MTPRQRAEMDRLKGRVRILEARNSELAAEAVSAPRPRRPQTRPRIVPKASLDRLIWLVHEIESKPKGERWIKVALSASDGRMLRRLAESLVR